MKKILFLFLTSVSCLGVGNIRTVNDLSELTSTNNNPRTILTNYMVINIGQLFYWDNNNTGATNASLLESLYIKDILGLSTGRFQRFAFTSVTNGDTYITNLYVSNIITTNITVNNLTVTTNITIGGTNVPTINPTIGKYPYKDGTNSFGDGAITHIDATTAGVDEMDTGTLVVTNLMTGGFVISRTDGIMTNVPPNTIYLTGTTNVGIDSQIILGPGTTNVLYRDGKALWATNGEPLLGVKYDTTKLGLQIVGGGAPHLYSTADIFVDQRLVTLGIIPLNSSTYDIGQDASNGYYMDLWQNGKHYVAGFGYSGNYSRLAISHSGTNGAVVFDSQSAGTAGNPRSIQFQFGGTNYYTFGYGASASMDVTYGSGLASFGLLSGGAKVEAASGETVYLRSGLKHLMFKPSSGYFAPNTDNEISLAGPSISSWYKDLGLRGSAYISGFEDGTNVSRLVVNHSGTNGVVNFTSEGIGSAGNPRPFKFSGADVIFANSHTPASSSETNYQWAVCADANYLYVWTATNVNKRVALSTW